MIAWEYEAVGMEAGRRVKVAICDATKAGRELCAGLLNDIEDKYQIPMEIDQYTTAEKMLFYMDDSVSRPDLLLLDVKVPGLDGIAAAKRIREMQYQMEIIFFTADPNHWPEAFDVDALHYLIKGEAGSDRVEQVIMKAVHRIGKGRETCFMLSCAGEDRIIPIHQIHYFSSDRRIVTVHYGPDDSTFEFYTPFGKLENNISNKGFIRVHKSYIVAVNYISSISLRGGVVLTNGERLPAGRFYFEKAKEIFNQYLSRAGEPEKVKDA